MSTGYDISTPALTFRLEVEAGRVTFATPVARWCVGKDLAPVLACWRRRGARVVRLGE